MMSLPPSASIPAASLPAPGPATPIPSASMQPPDPVRPTPMPEMTLFSKLTEQNISQPASNDTVRGAASITSLNTQLPPPNPEMVEEIIRLDPTLQAINPALIMAGITQGFHHTAAVANQAESPGRPPPPLSYPGKSETGNSSRLSHPSCLTHVWPRRRRTSKQRKANMRQAERMLHQPKELASDDLLIYLRVSCFHCATRF